MRGVLCLFVLVHLASCASSRGSCVFNSDCPSNNRCVSGRCVVNTADAGGTDGGNDAAFVIPDAGMDAGHDAAFFTPDTGHDAAPPGDAGHDAPAPVDAGHDAPAPVDANWDAFVSPTGSPLFFSEYVEGSANNKALEIVNVGTTTFDLTTCTVHVYSNGATTPSASHPLVGTLASRAVHTICNSAATGFSPATCSESLAASVVGFNGNDAIALVCGGVTIDVIGQIGFDPGAGGWGTTVSTLNQTLRRMCTVTMGDPNGANAFDPAAEWNTFAMDTFTGLGAYGCP